MTRALRTTLAATGLSIALVAGPVLALAATPVDADDAAVTAPQDDGRAARATLVSAPEPTALTLWIGGGAALLVGGAAVVSHTVRRERSSA
ncbi:hypothetical protein [Microbacterium sediminis]|nr:hypothetical protein [Microbacterium sediminis]QBR74174.1 hypothetical protein E3O41_06930 [Microbacterium sediminis]